MDTNVNTVKVQERELDFGLENRERYIRQYYALVEQFYKKDLNLDLKEHQMPIGLVDNEVEELIFLVRDGERVVAGAKLSFSSRNTRNGLPMEEGNFTVDGLLPEDYGTQMYAEIGRLVVDPDYRGKDVLQRMIMDTTRIAKQHGCGYLFVLAPALNAVLYRRICRSLGMPIELHKEAKLPDKPLYRQLDIKLLSSDIRGFDEVEEVLDIAV